MADLPEKSNADRMRAMPRDPESIFVYWNLDGGRREEMLGQLGGDVIDRGVWILKVTNLETGALSEVEVDPDASNWYLRVMSDSTYQIALGLKTDEMFHEVLTCPPVRTPPLHFSPLYDKQWMVLEEEYLRLLSLGWGSLGGSSAGGLVTRETETSWITVLPEPPLEEGNTPTSPGVPDYRGRK